MPEIKVPHQGYHWNHGSGRFFEGWYYRVTLPDAKQSFAFMYAIDDPQGNTAYSGGLVQVLGIDDQHIWRTLPNTKDFQASPDSSNLEHWGRQGEGYSASNTHNRGYIYDPGSSLSCTWDYQIEVITTWGDRQRPIPTMSWLSYFPIFEPGWQILTAHGLATGYITWGEQTFKFQNAPAYSEKNWGRSFPHQWFWLQCNAFPDHPGLSLTAAGGIREVLGRQQNVAMIGIHYLGESYIWLSTEHRLKCDILPWGNWQLQAISKLGRVEINAQTKLSGNLVMVPTATGAKFSCRDTSLGNLQLSLFTSTKTIKAASEQAALEVGGSSWEKPWQLESKTEINR